MKTKIFFSLLVIAATIIPTLVITRKSEKLPSEAAIKQFDNPQISVYGETLNYQNYFLGAIGIAILVVIWKPKKQKYTTTLK